MSFDLTNFFFLSFGTYGHKIQWNYSQAANTFKYYGEIWETHWCRLPNSSVAETEPAALQKKQAQTIQTESLS